LPRRANHGLNIGVTGHRLNRISQRQLERLAPQVQLLLAQIAHAARPHGLHLVSGLAEGADCHVAGLALDAGYALHALLPFERDTYALDFSRAASRRQFDELLARAATVTELPGRPGVSGQAYRRAGHALLDETDLLIAIWDGLPPRGPGGTAEVVDEAFRRSIPVIHVSTDGRTAPVLLWQRRGRVGRGRAAGNGTPSRPCGAAQVAAAVSHVMKSSP
jgi:hypothetical protein